MTAARDALRRALLYLRRTDDEQAQLLRRLTRYGFSDGELAQLDRATISHTAAMQPVVTAAAEARAAGLSGDAIAAMWERFGPL